MAILVEVEKEVSAPVHSMVVTNGNATNFSFLVCDSRTKRIAFTPFPILAVVRALHMFDQCLLRTEVVTVAWIMNTCDVVVSCRCWEAQHQIKSKVSAQPRKEVSQEVEQPQQRFIVQF